MTPKDPRRPLEDAVVRAVNAMQRFKGDKRSGAYRLLKQDVKDTGDALDAYDKALRQ